MSSDIDPLSAAGPTFSSKVNLLGVFVVILGLSVMLGWHLRIPQLIQLLPGFVPMQYNTAVCFFLVGTAILFRYNTFKPLLLICTGVTAIISLATLLQYIFNANWGVDELIVTAYLDTQTSHPGRMLPSTAIAFILSSIALSFSVFDQNRLTVSIILQLSIIVLTVSLVALIGYLFSLLGWYRLTHMAAHTAVGFMVIGSALLIPLCTSIKIHALPSVYKQTVPIGLVLIILVLTTWESLLDVEQRQLQHDLDTNIQLSAQESESIFRTEVEALKRMVIRWQIRRGTPIEEWKSDAAEYVRYVTGLSHIALVDNKGAVKHIISKEDTKKLLRQNLFEPNELKHAPYSTNNIAQDISFSYSNSLTDGLSILVLAALQPDEGSANYLAGIFNIEQLLYPIKNNALSKGYYVELSSPLGISLSHGEPTSLDSSSPWLSVHDFQLGNSLWTARAVPLDLFRSNIESVLPSLILFGGLAMTFLACFALHLLDRSNQKGSALEQEINVRKQKQIELNSTKEKLQLILDSAEEGIYGLDQEGRTTFANRSACRMTGFSRDEMEGKAQHDLIHHSHPDGSPYPREECQIYAALKDGVPRHIEDEHFWRKEGSSFPVSYSSTPIIDAQGQRLGAVVTFQDISERKRAEQELYRSNLELIRSNRELDQFAYIASHDLKSPLRGIDQLASWISEDLGNDLPPESQEHLKLMRNRIDRMEKLLDDLLTYSRIGKTNQQLKEISVYRLLQEIWSLISPPDHFRFEIPETLPTFITLSAPLEQVFRNLISNAIKHFQGDHGQIKISVEDNSSYYTFSVSDNGPGIDPKYHEQVFGLFQRLQSRDEVEGSGIGLAVVKKVVEKHGGQVQLFSNGHEGTTVTFDWPKASKLREMIENGY